MIYGKHIGSKMKTEFEQKKKKDCHVLKSPHFQVNQLMETPILALGKLQKIQSPGAIRLYTKIERTRSYYFCPFQQL